MLAADDKTIDIGTKKFSISSAEYIPQEAEGTITKIVRFVYNFRNRNGTNGVSVSAGESSDFF